MSGEPDDETVIERRTRVLTDLLGDRLPALVPYLPYVGAALGLAAGVALYLVIQTEALLLREAVVVASFVLGGTLGGVAETRARSWTLSPEPMIPADVTAEFRGAYREDHREAARARRPPI